MSLEDWHTWDPDEKYIACVPPPEMCNFGPYQINLEYRMRLYTEFPFYTGEEVVGSYLGYNPHFPSQEKWLKYGSQAPSRSESESESESDEDCKSDSEDHWRTPDGEIHGMAD